jgi:hypothetical protein
MPRLAIAKNKSPAAPINPKGKPPFGAEPPSPVPGAPVGITPEVVVVGARQLGTVIVLVSRVTAPFRARTRPFTVAPVLRVAEVSAKIVPTKLVEVPRVADEPTCQKTLQACTPFSRTMLAEDPVVKVEPAWKMNTASGFPPPFRVMAPVTDKLEEAV